MKVQLLENHIAQFLLDPATTRGEEWYFPHSLVQHFHEVWLANAALPLEERYEQALRSDISNRWWKGDAYRPKELMTLLIKTDPELAAIAWKDLQQKEAKLDGRLSRFEFYCSQLLDLHRKQNLRSIETHHHQDAAIMSLYIAGLFPDQFALYPGLQVFRTFLQRMGVADLPPVDDLVRYEKIAGIVFMYLKRNPAFETLLSARSAAKHKVKCVPFQVVYEVMKYAQ